MAHIKTGGTTKGNRDSRSKRLGIKLYGGQKAKTGDIIVRQKGTRVHPGWGTDMGKDFTIFSMREGLVKFYMKLGKQVVAVQ